MNIAVALGVAALLALAPWRPASAFDAGSPEASLRGFEDVPEGLPGVPERTVEISIDVNVDGIDRDLDEFLSDILGHGHRRQPWRRETIEGHARAIARESAGLVDDLLSHGRRWPDGVLLGAARELDEAARRYAAQVRDYNDYSRRSRRDFAVLVRAFQRAQRVADDAGSAHAQRSLDQVRTHLRRIAGYYYDSDPGGSPGDYPDDDGFGRGHRRHACGGVNVYGKWYEGGGCNVYGCWRPYGGCNVYGCWRDGGGCNVYGCWRDGGGCNVYGCVRGAPKLPSEPCSD